MEEGALILRRVRSPVASLIDSPSDIRLAYFDHISSSLHGLIDQPPLSPLPTQLNNPPAMDSSSSTSASSSSLSIIPSLNYTDHHVSSSSFDEEECYYIVSPLLTLPSKSLTLPGHRLP